MPQKFTPTDREAQTLDDLLVLARKFDNDRMARALKNIAADKPDIGLINRAIITAAAERIQPQQRQEEVTVSTINAMLIPPTDKQSPAQLAVAACLTPPPIGPDSDICHLRVDSRPDNTGFDEHTEWYGGPAASPCIVAIPPPAMGNHRYVQAVAYARDRDGIRTLATTHQMRIEWPA